MAIQREYETTRERLRVIFRSKLIAVEDCYNYFKTIIPCGQMDVSAVCGCLTFLHDDIGVKVLNTSGSIEFDNNDNCIIKSRDMNNYIGDYVEVKISNIKSQYRTIEVKIGEDDIWHNYSYISSNFVMPVIANALSVLYRNYYTGLMKCNW